MNFVRFKFYNFIFLIVLIVLVSFSAGYFFSQPNADFTSIFTKEKKLDKENFNLNLFWETLGEIQERYIGRDKLDNQKLIEGAARGMANSLNDPYTVFLDSEELKKFNEGIDGIFEGIGTEIGIKNNIITVIAPLEDSPAQKAGIKSGDKILKINETVTVDMTVEQAVEKIRGPKGTTVSLLINREGFGEAKEIKITREVINVPSVKWTMKKDSIAYVQLFRFGPKTETISELNRVAREIINSGAKKIVLDLRNNPGGFLETSVEAASIFMPSGKLVVTEDYGNGKKEEYKTSGKPLFEDYPLVILVNQGSASAAEILAGALRDQKQTLLIGEKTFGKGSVQELESLKQGGALKITVAKWLTPSGKSINDEGLKPDVEVKSVEEPEDSEKDAQLDKAIEIIKGM